MKPFDAFQHARKIWILGQVVDAGNLRQAALRIKVSPAAISQSITALEKAAGGPLIVRGSGKVTATELAAQILRIAGPALEALGSFGTAPGAAASTDAYGHIAWISLGSYESLAVDVLPRLTARLAARLPRLKLTVRVSRTGTLATMVRKGELCAALVTETDALEGLLTVPVAEDRLGYWVNAGARGDSAWQTITEGRVGTISPGPDGYPGYYTRFIQSTVGKGFRPAVLSDSFEALRALAVSGGMAAVLPARVAGRTRGELLEVRPPRANATLGRHRICLVSQPNCDPAEIRLLTDELRDLFAATEGPILA